MKRILLIALLLVFVDFSHSQFRDAKKHEILSIGIAKKKLALKESPKKLSKKLDINVAKYDSVLIIENQNINNKYFHISTFGGRSGWVSKKHVRLLEKKIQVSKIIYDNNEKSKNEKFDELVEKIEAKSKTTKENLPKKIENSNNKKNNTISEIKDSTKNENLHETAKEVSKFLTTRTLEPSKVNEPDTDSNNYLIIFSLIALIIGAIYLIIMLYKDKKELVDKYSPIIDLDDVLEAKQSEREKLDELIEQTKEDYKKKKIIFDRLQKEVAILDDELIQLDFGIYQPKFDFGTSKDYKNKISEIIDRQRKMVKDAIYSSVEVYILDNKTAGNKMINTYKKIAMRCFNNETSTIMKNVKWNNVIQSEQKIQKSYKAVNDFLSSLKMHIKKDYLDLKIEELNARYEYSVILNEERDKIREENARIREEEKAQGEFENARLKAEKEEEIYQKALDEAKKQLGLLSDDEAKKLEEQIDSLKSQLEKAKEDKERAKSMAQMTKVGHVYIISNIGSFGEQVYKIGLTRRLEPMVRVKELGDASVPFSFDVHAMIFSENAPELESALHKVFDGKRVNLVNRRKEYFRVELEEIEREVKKMDDSIEFIKISEAIEYNQTLAILNEQLEIESKDLDSQFPDSI